MDLISLILSFFLVYLPDPICWLKTKNVTREKLKSILPRSCYVCNRCKFLRTKSDRNFLTSNKMLLPHCPSASSGKSFVRVVPMLISITPSKRNFWYSDQLPSRGTKIPTAIFIRDICFTFVLCHFRHICMMAESRLPKRCSNSSVIIAVASIHGMVLLEIETIYNCMPLISPAGSITTAGICFTLPIRRSQILLRFHHKFLSWYSPLFRWFHL